VTVSAGGNIQTETDIDKMLEEHAERRRKAEQEDDS
jgi:hypothetical protein